ncbi:beta-lactamase family protein [Bradyrhizobium sp. U87765 SZCCT0131]|uniref:serine hydrolase domain-containing protein n=1 Tax=unclassified Bradyrhizobium TaxID=2631580 RepID=UPI001BADDC08|nr:MULTISPECIES: serine hydrolase domain-containing protein [unclassified Bradyrhizobium]MBR1216633.1 beta-lactamase family protein [Bradyrhizobium sp. U87765 SZCCT0131]MBR1259611.1 beta-lactamase family protein [Bradyrhizobium sp. U87765 SZCCT0134]MBR1305752.1 beta-lactamase family protein [Bradyrhizobium sp. U87765 SZCCT0110]MBR1322119.1 beta-lactamase family protein [Bradyrhizobium sp. U87765 SZCCT0109]MBR1350603.1 beta-lactamase family protein [Bradyrhizobium sp. U87765 SZCCT0048]
MPSFTARRPALARRRPVAGHTAWLLTGALLGLPLAGCKTSDVLGPAVEAAAESPTVCTAAKPYAGQPLHAAPSASVLPPRAALAGQLPAATADKLEAALDTAFKATQAQAMTAAVALPGKGQWTGMRGTDKPLFFWASAGKQAIAVVVLQLAEERKLRLSDQVSRWIDGVPNGDLITVEHLLSHTSGLYSANEDEAVHRRGGRMTRDEEMAILRHRGALFCPGENWRYSNSGYALLGDIISRADGRPWRQAIEARIIDRLGLKGMRVAQPGMATDDIALPAAANGEDGLDITVPGAAGALIASASDMVRFEQAVLDGELLKTTSRRQMLAQLYPMFDAGTFYGFGVMVYDRPDTPRRLYWIGHSGGGAGVRAVVAYDPHRRAFAAVSLNGGAGDAHASANLLLKTLD